MNIAIMMTGKYTNTNYTHHRQLSTMSFRCKLLLSHPICLLDYILLYISSDGAIVAFHNGTSYSQL